MGAEYIAVNDLDYKAKLASTNGIILFYKNLCPNCKALEKVIDKFIAANTDVQYIRVDSEECPGVMSEFNVERVPTILILKAGRILGRKVGLMNLREMTHFYEHSLI